MKKLFEVTIQKTLYVLADDEREAEYEAKTFESDEEGSVYSCMEVADLKYVPKEWKDGIAYGENPDELSVKEILELPLPPVPFKDPPEQGWFGFAGSSGDGPPPQPA